MAVYQKTGRTMLQFLYIAASLRYLNIKRRDVFHF
jgi:hypothetical protein